MAKPVINLYDVLSALGDDGWYVDGASGGLGAPAFIRVRLNPDANHRTPGRDIVRTKRGPWERATGGEPVVWVTVHKMGAWFPASLADRLRTLVSDRTGKPVKVGDPTTAAPCGEYVTPRDTWGGGHTCAKPVKPGSTMCGTHAGAAARREAKKAEYQARMDARVAERDRRAEAERATIETLARISPVLEELGLMPAVVKVDGGSFVVPPEMLESLVEQVVDVLGVLGDRG